MKFPPATIVGVESPAAGLIDTPSSVTSPAAAIRPLTLVPDGSDALKAPFENTAKFAACPSEAQSEAPLAGAARTGVATPIAVATATAINATATLFPTPERIRRS